MKPGSRNAVRKMLREDYLGASTFVEKGWNLIATGHFEGAEAVLLHALDLAPNFIEGHYELGRAQLSAGRLAEARHTWKAGHAVNRFNIWGKRCAEALRLADRGEQPVSYS